MPIVRVTIAKGRDADQKRAAAEAITDALVAHCGAEAAHVYILFEEIDRDAWIAGGEARAMRTLKSSET